MPRSSSTSRSGSSKPSIPYSSPHVHPHWRALPAYTPSIQVGQPTMFQSVIQGFGLGMGSSIARNMFEHKQPVVQYPAPLPSSSASASAPHSVSDSAQKTYEIKKFEFKKCMENTNDYDTCVQHLE